MPQLDYSTYPGQILWLLLCFGLLYIFVRFLFVPRIERLALNRANQIKQNLLEAEILLAKAHELKIAIESELKVVNEAASIAIANAEREIKYMLEKQRIQHEELSGEIVKQQNAELSLWYSVQVNEHLPQLVDHVKADILQALLKNLPMKY